MDHLMGQKAALHIEQQPLHSEESTILHLNSITQLFYLADFYRCLLRDVDLA